MTACWSCGGPTRVRPVVVPLGDGRSRTVEMQAWCDRCDVGEPAARRGVAA